MILRYPVKFKDHRFPSHDDGQECAIDFQRYHDGNLAIQLTCIYDVPEEGLSEEPWAVVTVNLPQAPQAPGEIYIKNWSENEGIEQLLKAQGIITGEPTGKWLSGFVAVPRYKLHPEVLTFLSEHNWEA
jgi:hypothetical protein